MGPTPPGEGLHAQALPWPRSSSSRIGLHKMCKEPEESAGWEEMSPPYLPEKKPPPWLGKGCQRGEQRRAGEGAAASQRGELWKPRPPPASLTGEQRGPPQVVIKNASSRPPTCPAIRPTKAGETSLRMMPPKDKTLSQACFHFRVPTGDRAEKGPQPSDKWEQRPPSSGALAQSQGRAGPQSSALLTAHPTDKRC